MKRPFLFPALALWGVQMDWWWLGLVLGLLFEAPRVVPFRVEIAQRDFERLWSFTAVLFLGVVFYLLLADRGLGVAGSLLGNASVPPGEDGGQDGLPRISTTALVFLHGMPLVLMPFTLAHAWSTSLTLPWSTFSLYEQARARREPLVPPPTWAVQPMHPGLAYQGVVLFIAVTLPDPGRWFLPCWVLAILLALWPWRPRHRGAGAWLATGAALASLAWLAHSSHDVTRQAWDLLEQSLQRGYMAGGGEVQRRVTALGTIGRLQLSGEVQLRGEHPPGHPPGLLTEAVFDRFLGQGWESSARVWQTVTPIVGPPDPTLITVTRSTDRGHAMLVTEEGAAAIHLMAPQAVESNAHGSLRLLEGPPLVVYQLAPGGTVAQAPTAEDLSLAGVPETDLAAAQAVLADLTPPLAPALTTWLAQHCTYTLDQEAPPLGQTPVADFLTRRRQGHCEYFAAATVLVLRVAGVPARYAVGFVPEAGKDTWVARGRNAHAWAQAWIDGRWQVVDTTPGSWREGQETPWWEGVQDGWSWLMWRFDRWRAEGGNWRLVVFVVGIAVLLWIGWRQVRGSRWLGRRSKPAHVAPVPGIDSPLLTLVQGLERMHGPRPAGMPLRPWLAAHGIIGDLVDLHERWRFAPGELTQEEQRRLADLVARIPLPSP